MAEPTICELRVTQTKPDGPVVTTFPLDLRCVEVRLEHDADGKYVPWPTLNHRPACNCGERLG